MAEKTRFVKLDVEIDEPIADLIIRLNQNHLPTRFCCCGHPLTTHIVLHMDRDNEYVKCKNTDPHAYISFYKFNNTEKYCELIVKTLTQDIVKTCDVYTKYSIKNDFSDFLNFVKYEKRKDDDNITIRLYYKAENFEINRQKTIDCMQKILTQFIKEEFGYDEEQDY